MKTWALGLTLAATFILSACGGPRAFTRGEYGDPNEISMLDDKWNQNDMQLVAKKMIGSMEGWIDGRAVEKPVVILEAAQSNVRAHRHAGALRPRKNGAYPER